MPWCRSCDFAILCGADLGISNSRCRNVMFFSVAKARCNEEELQNCMTGTDPTPSPTYPISMRVRWLSELADFSSHLRNSVLESFLPRLLSLDREQYG